jgi:hypothetical protein
VTTKVKDSTASSKRKVKSPIKKGKQFERECANIMGHIFPEAKRHLEYQADEALEGIDLEGTDIFRFQMKNRQNYVSVGTIKEIRTKDPNHIPVLVTKGNRLEPMAVLPFEKFVTLLEVAYGLRLPFNEKLKQLRYERAEEPPFTELCYAGVNTKLIDELI